MQKRILLISAVIAMIAVAGILIFTRRSEIRFDGDRISDPGRFVLQFERMNRSDSESMTLAEGNALRVSWEIESCSPHDPGGAVRRHRERWSVNIEGSNFNGF